MSAFAHRARNGHADAERLGRLTHFLGGHFTAWYNLRVRGSSTGWLRASGCECASVSPSCGTCVARYRPPHGASGLSAWESLPADYAKAVGTVVYLGMPLQRVRQEG